MSTSLLNCEIALSKELGDYWSSTTTGAGSTTTLVDSALIAKTNDWLTDEAYAFLIEEPASTAAIYDERKATGLVASTGILTTLAFSEAPGTGIDYELHRLFSPSEKRRALVSAAASIYPSLFKEIWDESQVSGNWLKDGSLEIWTSATALTYWTTSASTLAQTSTAGLFKHGLYSCKISTAAGYIQQSITNFDDLKRLAGKTVTFTVQGWCDTASCLRISIYDGVNDETYSDYHDGDSAWTEDRYPLEVTQTIDDNPTEITFKIYHALEAASETTYVDDARVISDYRGKLYIGNLGLAQNRPHQVFIEPNDYSQEEDWLRVNGYKIDKDGYIYIPTTYPSDYRLRIRGIGYLDFLASGVSSTAWTATIELDEPQIKILTAQAAVYLYTWMSMPNYESGTRGDYQQMIGFWEDQLSRRKLQFHMKSPPATVDWGIY